MKQSETLRASASLRALFFDHSPRPMLTGFVDRHALDIEIEATETNFGLVLLSQLIPEEGHVSDYIASSILSASRDKEFPLNEAARVAFVHSTRQGFDGVMKRSQIWEPTSEEDAEINSFLSGSTNVGPMQMLGLTRWLVKLQDWGNLRIGYLKGIPITRRKIIEHVANHLGGVHYDSNRTPRDVDDLAQFRVLASAMDWDDQALTPTGFVAVGLACIEVLNSDGVRELYGQICQQLDARQQAIIDKANEAVAACRR